MDQPKKKIMNDMVVRRPVNQSQKPNPAVSVKHRTIADDVKIINHNIPEDYDNNNDNDDDIDYEPEIMPVRRAVSSRTEPVNHRGWFLWAIAIVCSLALVIGVGGLFARAEITVVPKTFSGDVNTTISFSQNPESGSVFFGTATKTFTDEIIVPATGVVTKESKASGKVHFYNTNTIAKTIPVGTKIVSSKKMVYQTIKTVTVPAITKKTKTPGTIEVGVTATVVGSASNTDPDDFTFDAPKSFANITIRSSVAIVGGAQGSDSIADPVAISVASDTLRARFADPSVLVKRIADVIPDDFTVLPIIINPSAPVVVPETNHPDGVHVVAKQTVGIIMVKKHDLSVQSGLARALGNQLSADKNINLTFQNFDHLTIITGTAMSATAIPAQFTARVSGTATLTGFVDRESLRSQMVGITKSGAKNILEKNTAIQSFKLQMRPFWRRTMPISEKSIIID